MKYLLRFVLAVVLLAALIYGYNFISLTYPVNQRLADDSRNSGVGFNVHYQSYINPSAAVIDLDRVKGSISEADVFRAFLQISDRLKDKDFKEVLLASNGVVKFQITGAYFKELGQSFATQNPVYSVRTFPEHLYTPTGENAYGTVTGGLLGVLGKQMEDFADFSEKWYLDDLKAGRLVD